jgi:hypothetical protein
MQPLTNRFTLFAVREWMFDWSRVLVEFFLNQGFVQAVGMLSGLIYVQVMPVDQYALYAMGLASLSFISTGSDLGLSNSLGYFWRRTNDESIIVSVFRAIRRLRSVLLLFASLISGALLLKTAIERNLSILLMFSCFSLVVVTVWTQLGVSIDIGLMRLEGKQRESYYCEAIGSITRFLFACAVMVTGLGTAFFGLAGGVLGVVSMVAAVRVFGHRSTNKPEPIGRDTWRAIGQYIIPTLPTTVVYMAQDPLMYWLTLTFGGQSPLSETFALGRIGAIYGLLGLFVAVVLAPRLARLRNDAKFVQTAFLYLLVILVICAALTTVGYLAPWLFLWLVGSKYAHLHKELVLALTAASFGVLISFVAMANRLRGWVRLEPLGAATQAVAVVVLSTKWQFQDSASVLELMVVLAGLSLFSALSISTVGLFAPTIAKVVDAGKAL